MVIETSGAQSVIASSSAPATPTAKPAAAASKSTPPNAKSTPRRSLPAQNGGGDADVIDNSVAAHLGGMGVLDVSNRSTTTGDDSYCSSGSSGSVVEQRNAGPRGEDELSSRSLSIQGKRFYVDVKQNPRGRFIKIAEVLPDGSKSRVALSMTSAREFRNHLTQFNDFYASAQKVNSARKMSSSSSDGDYGRSAALKSAVIYGNGGSKLPVVGRRRYFLDLKENRRGKFLQVAESSNRAGIATRNRIVIPAQGMVEFRNNLSDLLCEYWPNDDASLGPVDEGDSSASKTKEFPQPKSLRVHQGKVLYFDSGCNPRGSYLRISQVTTRFRTSILLPRDSLTRVHSMLGEILNEFDAPKEAKPAKVRSSPARGAAATPRSGGAAAAAARNAAIPAAAAIPKGQTGSPKPLAKVAEE